MIWEQKLLQAQLLKMSGLGSRFCAYNEPPAITYISSCDIHPLFPLRNTAPDTYNFLQRYRRYGAIRYRPDTKSNS